MADSLTTEQAWANTFRTDTLDERRGTRRLAADPTERQDAMRQSGTNEASTEYQAAGVRAKLLALRDRGEGKKIVDRMVANAGAMQQLAAAQAAMRAQYGALWEQAELGLEQLCLGFFTLGTVFFGPLVVGVFMARLLATQFNGFGEFGFRGFSVPKVAPLSLPAGPLHAALTALIGIWTLILWLGLAVFIYAATNPTAAAQLLLCGKMPIFCPK